MRRLPRLIRPTNGIIFFGSHTPLTPAITGLVPRKNQSCHTVDNAQQTLVTIPAEPSVFFAANRRFFAQERSPLPAKNADDSTNRDRSPDEVGIILVTGRSDRIDRIVGLEMGADDYVTKPLELRELVVRVKNLLWRIDLARQAQPHTQDNCYRFAGYCLNVSRHTLERDGEPIKLTRAEYEMLVAFVTNPGEILSRERLLRMLSARRVENPDLRTVDVLIRRLRHKLSADLLVTQHGEGYFLAADVC